MPTLIHNSGQVHPDQLGGKIAGSAHPLPKGGLGIIAPASKEIERISASLVWSSVSQAGTALVLS